VESEIPDDFEFLRVTIMTGDEIIEVYLSDPEWGDAYLYETLDEGIGDGRCRDFLDATYFVYPDQIEDWNKRGGSYHIYEREKFKETYRGYVGFIG
jgi:hypothetical protein